MRSLADLSGEAGGIEFEFVEETNPAVRVHVPGKQAEEFRENEKHYMNFFQRLGELLQEADTEEQNETYRDEQVEDESTLEAIKRRQRRSDAE